jgi:hypothetical protein
VPFQFKGLPWRNSELSEMSVQFFYEFASENARNAVIELQDSTIVWRRTPSHPFHPINRKLGEVQLPMFCKHVLVYIKSKVPFHEILPPLPSHRSGVPEVKGV